ncbi:MAG: hypothetical protein HYX47_08560 [Burkholderiales bacterium]|nr:hypothetical protein [Burkholderiales bacterium]
MPAQVFGAQATAVQLYQAFYGAFPGNPAYATYVATQASSSPQALALEIGAQFAATADSALATQVLANLGITPATVAPASYSALQAALAQAFEAYPGQRGVVVLNLATILTGLESDATYGVAAQAYNQTITAGYLYSSSAANSTPSSTGGAITLSLTAKAGDIVTGTSGNDTVNAALFFDVGAGYVQTLQSGDSINGAGGTDTLNATINNSSVIIPTALISVEILNATVTAAATLDNANGSGLSTVSLNNSTAQLDLTNLSSLLGTLQLKDQATGIVVTHTAAAIAGTADTLALALSGLSAGNVIGVNGYETVNVAGNGSATNTVSTLNDTSLKTLSVSGAAGVVLSSGTGITGNTLTLVNASASTGGVTLGSLATGLGVADQSVTGGSGNDTFFFGANLTTADTVNGGLGTDTIAVQSVSAAGVSTTLANLSGLEVLSIIDQTSSAIYTPGAFGGATALSIGAAGAGGNITVNYLAGTSGLTLTNAVAQTGTKVLNIAGFALSDVLNITLGNPAAVGAANTGAMTINGAETVNIASNGTSSNALGTLTLSVTAAAEVVNITGTAALSLGAVTADAINAGGNTGGLVMLTGTIAATGIVITGSGAADTLYGGAAGDIIDGGAGNDRIQGGAANAASQADLLTGGTGADTFYFVGTNNANLSKFSAGTTAVTKITDFVAGTDKIGLLDGSATAITFSATQTIASAADLNAVYSGITAIAKSSTTLSAAMIVVNAGAAAGLYLYVNDAANGAVTAADDMLVDVTGISGSLGAADFVFS